MIAPETLAAALRVAQHGAHRAMQAVQPGMRQPADMADTDTLHATAAAAQPLPRAGHAERPHGRSAIAGPLHGRSASN